MLDETLSLWKNALEHNLRKRGYGAKKEVAEAVGISPNYLSNILSGQRNPGQRLQEAIAMYFGYSLLEFYLLGDHISKGNLFLGKEGVDLPPHSAARAEKIINKVLADLGFMDLNLISSKHLMEQRLAGGDDYLSGQISDVEYYDRLHKLFREVLRKALANLKLLERP
jgi:transcriptional regulator with XRE-family HTH domain